MMQGAPLSPNLVPPPATWAEMKALDDWLAHPGRQLVPRFPEAVEKLYDAETAPSRLHAMRLATMIGTLSGLFLVVLIWPAMPHMHGPLARIWISRALPIGFCSYALLWSRHVHIRQQEWQLALSAIAVGICLTELFLENPDAADVVPLYFGGILLLVMLDAIAARLSFLPAALMVFGQSAAFLVAISTSPAVSRGYALSLILLQAICAFFALYGNWRLEAEVRHSYALALRDRVARDTLGKQIAVQQALAEDLAQARDAAEAGNRAKAQFLAMISHELRTPLNGVIGLAGLLLDGTLDAQSTLHAKMLRDAADHLMELINDLLDFTKLEVDRLEFEALPYALDGVVQSALDLLAGRAHAKGLEIGAFVSPDVPPYLIGDSGRLRQVLLNLLGNAVKFTATGSVILDVAARDKSGGMCELEFSVADTGPGIPADEIPLLFEEFSQLDSTVSRQIGGTGLGLAICRRLVRRMGGDISVGSRVGEGSVFRFTIRQQPAPRPAGDPPSGQVRLAGQKILVLHAGAIGGGLLARQIAGRGGAVSISPSPEAALRALHDAAQAGAPFQACVVDHGLPASGAESFAASVRAEQALRAPRLVLVSTSDFGAAGKDADRFDARLLKPVPVNTLIYRLEGAHPAGTDDLGEATESAAGKAPGMRILVAEDNKTNQAVIRAMLAKLGHRADIVANGQEAVQAVHDRPYDLVLMDVMMPELDGLAATACIRALPGKAALVPVVALTADASLDRHAIYRAAGMQAVLTKPLSLQALSSALAQWRPG
jgi:signal transduction histidine kinase/CheY-like chemotaxis protein